MPRRDNELLVGDIIECFRNILTYTKGYTYEEFVEDNKTIDAVIRNFEIIGEASKLLSYEFKSKHPEVEWRKLTNFRNVLIHDYFGVDYDMLWQIIETQVSIHLEFLETLGQ